MPRYTPGDQVVFRFYDCDEGLYGDRHVGVVIDFRSVQKRKCAPSGMEYKIVDESRMAHWVKQRAIIRLVRKHNAQQQRYKEEVGTPPGGPYSVGDLVEYRLYNCCDKRYYGEMRMGIVADERQRHTPQCRNNLFEFMVISHSPQRVLWVKAFEVKRVISRGNPVPQHPDLKIGEKT